MGPAPSGSSNLFFQILFSHQLADSLKVTASLTSIAYNTASLDQAPSAVVLRCPG